MVGRLLSSPEREPSLISEVRAGMSVRRDLVAGADRRLAGALGGFVWCTIIATLLLLLVPAIPVAHRFAIAALAACAVPVAVGSLLLTDWRRAPMWLFAARDSMAVLVVTIAVWADGGAASPAWILLFLGVLYAAAFYSPVHAALYALLCASAQALPLLYDPGALHWTFVLRCVFAASVYAGIAVGTIAMRSLMWLHRFRATRSARQHEAMSAISTAVVHGAGPGVIYGLAAREIGTLIGGERAVIMRLDGPRTLTVMGCWSRGPAGRRKAGTTVIVKPGDSVEESLTTGEAIRVDVQPPDHQIRAYGHVASVVAPIRVRDESPWGVISVTTVGASHLLPDDGDRLMSFCDLLATAIRSLEDRAKLAAQASTDPLTGLANHRVLHDRLQSETLRAEVSGRSLAVAMLDIDRFKQINDTGGHKLGDEVLIHLATCLGVAAQQDDLIGRTGGDEFVWVMPSTTGPEALARVEAARALVASAITRECTLTFSCGICDSASATDAAELIRLADSALYWSKANGRDRAQLYDPALGSSASAVA